MAAGWTRTARAGLADRPAEEDDLAPGGRLPMLTVRNGAAVRVALTQWRPQTTPNGAGAAMSPRRRPRRRRGPGPGQAVLRGQDRWQADTASLTLQPAWPGGRQPVSLRYDLSLPQARTAPTEGPPPRMEGAGELLLPLNQWTPLGQWAPAPPAGRGGVSYSTRDARPASEGGIRWLEVRVTRP
jgi:hypothetical protein